MTRAIYEGAVYKLRWLGFKDGKKMASIENGGTLLLVPSERLKFLENKRRKLNPPLNTWDWRKE